jgi:hypothetical protein
MAEITSNSPVTMCNDGLFFTISSRFCYKNVEHESLEKRTLMRAGNENKRFNA